jgi:type 1 glutamine amidotransferase
MEQHKRILVLGDNKDAPYHPLHGVDEQLNIILGCDYTLEFCDDYVSLDINTMKSYSLIISYVDCWNKALPVSFAADLATYVINGGSLLVIHNGISIQIRYELAQLMGAKFLNHPERCNLSYTDFNKDHPIMEEVTPFELFEEPYQFEFDPFTEKEILFYYHFDNRKIPAAWTQEYGNGRVVYLSPGHDTTIFHHESYRRIIQNSATWLI